MSYGGGCEKPLFLCLKYILPWYICKYNFSGTQIAPQSWKHTDAAGCPVL